MPPCLIRRCKRFSLSTYRGAGSPRQQRSHAAPLGARQIGRFGFRRISCAKKGRMYSIRARRLVSPERSTSSPSASQPCARSECTVDATTSPGSSGTRRREHPMIRVHKRTFGLACVLACVAAAVFAAAASANYSGAVSINCTSATYSLTNFPSGPQDVLETVFVDGAVAAQTTFSFTGPTAGPSVVSFTIPSDGFPHTIEANVYSITNATPVFGLPGIVTLTCGTTPPPPSVCTYTKGFYRNHSDVTAAVVSAMGGSVKAGSTTLSAGQAQTVLNATPGAPGNVTFTSNVLLNLVQ